MTHPRQPSFGSIVFCLAVLTSGPGYASFHDMQIEQIIGGVNGDTSAQAIQLRMRLAGQDLIQQARLVVRDATGSNAVVLIAFPQNVNIGSQGARILIASSNFADQVDSPLHTDFFLTNLIPADYLAAGSLTYEDDFGDVLWRVSFGGTGYTGPNTGSLENDNDGNFGPPFDGPLPTDSFAALQFQGAANALSNSNVVDYAVTTDAAVFFNNSGQSVTVKPMAHDLAVTKMKVSKKITLTEAKPSQTRKVVVTIQNRSAHDEIIPDLGTLTNLVTVSINSSSKCAVPLTAPPATVPRFPITWMPEKSLTLTFNVTYDCPGGFSYTAMVHHDAIDGKADTHSADNNCPHDPLVGSDPYPDGTIKDKGCGSKKSDNTLGGAVMTTVIQK